MRQAYANEVLVGLASVAIPLTTGSSPCVGEVINGIPNSLAEEHVDVPGQDYEASPENENREKAADNDADAAKDAEAIEQLRSFLEGNAREKATPQMMFSLAGNCALRGGAVLGLS